MELGRRGGAREEGWVVEQRGIERVYKWRKKL